MTQHLPSTSTERKDLPLYSGFVRYFPDAMIAVAELSRVGNDQHNPGEPLHWARGKSGDELDALLRHLVDAGTRDTDGVRHSTKVAWRAMANLQKEIERERETRKHPEKSGGEKAPAGGTPGEDGQPLQGRDGGLVVLRREGGHVGGVEVGEVFPQAWKDPNCPRFVPIAGHLAQG